MLDGIRVHEDVKTQPWKKPWLIQRVEAPRTTKGNGLDLSEVFSFGGGLARGGLSKEASALISKLWSWDYMGASEYEWGAVPAALNAMVKYRQQDYLDAFELVVEGPLAVYRSEHDKKQGWGFEKVGQDDMRTVKTKVFVACNKAHRDNVVATLTKMVSHRGYGDGIDLCEPARAWEACMGPKDVVGGLELNNAWLYLVPAKVSESIMGFCSLFELTPEVVVDVVPFDVNSLAVEPPPKSSRRRA